MPSNDPLLNICYCTCYQLLAVLGFQVTIKCSGSIPETVKTSSPAPQWKTTSFQTSASMHFLHSGSGLGPAPTACLIFLNNLTASYFIVQNMILILSFFCKLNGFRKEYKLFCLIKWWVDGFWTDFFRHWRICHHFKPN